MARTREARVLLEDEEYERLETLASQRRVSISDLIREAVRDRFTPSAEQRRRAVEAICRINIPLPEWDVLEAEIADTHGSDLP
ncbi:MAG TPA: CopG family transcriptional regulator [Thermoanaerobaculia bacterium]|nr:CopG family transcriptional regulator [Thermoanaerobaculia bacterium]